MFQSIRCTGQAGLLWRGLAAAMATAKRCIEIFVALPGGQSAVVQLDASATGSELADLVLAELGLGTTARNRKKLDLVNRDTGMRISGDDVLGSIGKQKHHSQIRLHVAASHQDAVMPLARGCGLF